MVRLRTLLRERDCLLVPGVYDCLSARLAQASGFEAVAISGYSVEASRYGLPDLGFAGLTDMAEVAGRIASAVDLPVICDADTGYGGPAQVWQTVRRLERAGVDALHIEDQVTPKKCGGLPGRRVVPVEEMCANVRAACAAREDRDLLVIARTDAKAELGLEEAARRLNAYLEAGADMAFAAEAYTAEELRTLAARVRGPLAICAGVPDWPGSFETRETYAAWGIRLVVYPFSSLFVAARAMHEFYDAMHARQGVSASAAAGAMCGFSWFSDFIGIAEWGAREERFLSGEGHRHDE